jgi:hypothetical protein
LRKPKWVAVLAAMLAIVLILALPAMGQVTEETEQEAESGEIDQSFEVAGDGSNSNQCASIQGVPNTGNSQNVIDLIQYESITDDFEFEEVGSTVDVSPTNTTTCDQQVNQAASAAA